MLVLTDLKTRTFLGLLDLAFGGNVLSMGKLGMP
jgi:hypothetical protein